jgi:hypothetical protein
MSLQNLSRCLTDTSEFDKDYICITRDLTVTCCQVYWNNADLCCSYVEGVWDILCGWFYIHTSRLQILTSTIVVVCPCHRVWTRLVCFGCCRWFYGGSIYGKKIQILVRTCVEAAYILFRLWIYWYRPCSSELSHYSMFIVDSQILCRSPDYGKYSGR